VRQTNHLPLSLRLRKRVAVPPLPCHAFTACRGTTLPFTTAESQHVRTFLKEWPPQRTLKNVHMIDYFTYEKNTTLSAYVNPNLYRILVAACM
jgi:hypothetical protein